MKFCLVLVLLLGIGGTVLMTGDREARSNSNVQKAPMPSVGANPKAESNRLKETKQLFVSPDPAKSGKGTRERPYKLSTALRKVKSGGTIVMMPGVYRSTLEFDRKNHVGVTLVSEDKQNPAVLDGYIAKPPRNETILGIYVSNVTIKDLVITNSTTDPAALRMTYSDPQGGNPNQRGAAIHDRATGTRIINCIIHDTGAGLHGWQNGSGQIYYGNLIFNNGTDAPDRLHGQGIYTQNRIGTKLFESNIVFNNFDSNLQMYGSDRSASRGMNWK